MQISEKSKHKETSHERTIMAVNEEEQERQNYLVLLQDVASHQYQQFYEKDDQDFSPAVVNFDEQHQQLQKDFDSPTPDDIPVTTQNEDESSQISFEREIFLEQVRKYPCLWDVNSFLYKDRTVKNNAWAVLAKLFGKDVDYLQKQLKNLKDNLKKCLNKRNRMIKSGAPASVLPKCKYFEQMRFLHEKTGNRNTESNVELPLNISTTNPTHPSNLPSPTQFQLPNPPSNASTATFSSPNSISSSTSTGKKRKSSTEDFILKEISNINNELKVPEEKDCEDMLFCKSIVPLLKRLTRKKNRSAKIKISQLLYEIEFDEKFE